MKPQPRNRIFWLVMATGLVLLLGGCGSSPTISNSVATTPPTTRYRIGPGDALEIFVRDNPKLTTTVPVRPDGRISIPLVQSVMAEGKTPNQLASELEKKLSQYIRSPLVTVVVKSFVGAPDQQVRVVGQAMKPEGIPYRRGMTLLDVMIDVGGLTKFAAGNDAKIVRRMPDGKKKTIPVNLSDLLDGAIQDNKVMHPGDILIIPRSLF